MAERRLNRAFLALGSNIDPRRNLSAACAELAGNGVILASSRVWQTVPVGFREQPPFLNAAVLLETPASARALRCDVIPVIESGLQRVRDPDNRNGPRTIDIDIALFNRDVIRVDGCRIPDPDILTRPYLALTLAELDAGYVHPETGATLAEIASTLSAESAQMRLCPDVVLSAGTPR